MLLLWALISMAWLSVCPELGVFDCWNTCFIAHSSAYLSSRRGLLEIWAVASLFYFRKTENYSLFPQTTHFSEWSLRQDFLLFLLYWSKTSSEMRDLQWNRNPEFKTALPHGLREEIKSYVSKPHPQKLLPIPHPSNPRVSIFQESETEIFFFELRAINISYC